MGLRIVLAIALVSLFSGPSFAGWLEDAATNALENAGRRGVDEATDSTYEGVKGKAKDTVTKESPKEEGNIENPQADAEPEEAPAPRKRPVKRATAKEASADETAKAPEVGGGTDIAAAEQIYSKYDFIPGDKVIFFDDFSDTDEGEFPRKWTLKGPWDGGPNAVEVVSYQGKKFLRSQPAATEADTQSGSLQYVRLDIKGDLPAKFTVEFDAVFANYPPPKGGTHANYYVILGNKDLGLGEAEVIAVNGLEGSTRNTRTGIHMADNKTHHVAVSVNGTFVKAYVDNQRVGNDPDGITRPVKYVGMNMKSDGGWICPTVMFTNFRLAEGGKDVKSALSTDGKIVTHGILFDTASDRIKPESLPTLKMILGLLEGDDSLKFSVEGHTDNQGGKAVNQPLSERRAAAVKDWLAGKGIAANRLQSKGWGDSKPIDKNDTPEGRSNNRRVEFVKIK